MHRVNRPKSGDDSIILSNIPSRPRRQNGHCSQRQPSIFVDARADFYNGTADGLVRAGVRLRAENRSVERFIGGSAENPNYCELGTNHAQAESDMEF